jgi:hypothetical protein
MCSVLVLWKTRHLHKTHNVTLIYKKKNFTLENYRKSVYSYHVTRTQVHIITISHIQSRETNLQSYHVTHTHKVIRKKYTFLLCYTHSYETNIYPNFTTECYGASIYFYYVKNSNNKQTYILTTLDTVVRKKYTFLLRHTQS